MSNSKLMKPGKWHIEYDENGRRIAHVYEDSTCRLLGYASVEEYINSNVPWGSTIHPDDIEELNRYIADIEAKHPEGMDYDAEYRIMTKQGYHWIHDCGYVVRREDGSPARIDGAAYDIQDIVEKRNLAKQLDESLAFTNFFLNTYVSAYYINLDNYGCQIYKRTNELEKSYPVIDNYLDGVTAYINRDVHPDDRAELLRIFSPDNLKRKLKEVSDFTHIFRDISGDTEKIYRVQIIRGADEHHAAFGFIDVTNDFNEQQRHLLGAIPLSSDILTKANIGLWSFELDEGCAPRMYADEAMLKLIGLEHQVSPEETYHAWYDRIDPDHYEEVAASVEKMTAGIHAEVQYPWHHPNGDVWIVRCGGVRNYAYTKGIRIEGTHQNVTDVAHFQRAKLGTIALDRDILTKADIGLWAFELDEGCAPRMYADEAMRKLIGLDHEVSPEETYHAWYDHIDAQHYEEVSDAVEKMTSGIHAEVQYPWHHPNGDTWVVRCGGVRNYAYTKGIRIEGTHQNVTALTHYEKRNLTDLLASLADNFLQVYFLDPYTGKFSSYAGNAFDSDGDRDYSQINFYQDVADRSGAIVHPDDKPLIDKMYSQENLISVLESGKPTEFIVRWPNGNGDECVYMKNRLVPFADDDGTKKLVIGVLDVTSEELSKKQIDENNALVEALSSEYHSLGLINGKTRQVRVIRKSELKTLKSGIKTVTSNPDYNEGLPKYINTSVFEEDRERVLKETCLEAVKQNTPEKGVYSVTYRRYDESGNISYHQLCFAKAETASGKTDYIYGFRDVDSIVREQMEQQRLLEEARERAEAANKAKTSFLFNMSHDIRTPMNAIIGFTDIAKKHIDDKPRVLESLDKVKISSEHLLSLINDILEMSRIEAGKIEIVNAPINAYEVTEGIVSMSRSLAEAKDITFNVKVNDLKNPYVYSDELHTNQIVINLISNAIKYTNPGGTVDYQIEQISDPEDGIARYRITVKDNGIGMSEEFKKHLFESFAREQSTTVSKQEGAGLGLAIVKNIIDIMKGSISVQSKLGEGSTFVVELPLEVMDEDAIEEFEASRKEKTVIAEKYSFDGQRILLAEDNEMNREIAAEILEEVGLQIDTAEDGALAVKKIQEKGVDYYDFILMDIQMPVMDGYAATKEIRKLPGGDKIKIIAVSANAFEEDVQKSLASGMNAHVAKPIDVKVLFETMQELKNK